MSKKTNDKQKLDEFFDEIDKKKSESISMSSNSSNVKHPESFPKPYQCPSCHQSLSSRKEPCKHCGYKGYIPMGDEEIKKTRIILFIIILFTAIVVYILTRK